MKKSNPLTSFIICLVVAVFSLGSAYSQAPYTIWNVRYNGPFSSQDSAAGIAVNGNGQVFVTGWSIGSGTARDIVTLRYSQFNGDSVWVNRYNGSSNLDDNPSAIVADNNFVYVTGWSFAPSRDIITIKYNVADGSIVWVKTYNGTGNGGDYGLAIAIDPSGNTYVTGRSDVGGSQKFTTIKYDVAGNVVSGWPSVYTGGLSGTFDESHAIQVDGSGNVYVTGFSSSDGSVSARDYLTLKIDGSGTVQWAKKYNGNANLEDNAVGLVLNTTGSVGAVLYVTGYSTRIGTSLDYVTLKYLTSSGDTIVSAVYNGPSSSSDQAVAITSDPFDNIYVTGSSINGSGYSDYATVAYNQFLGQSWVQRYTLSTTYNYAKGILYDTSGFVYVTGSSTGSGTGLDYLTVRYNSVSGNLSWFKRENGAANGNDYAGGIASSGPYNIYITGSANWGTPTGLDFYTIRYSEDIGVIPISKNKPVSFSLYQNFPNPFNPSTSIRFDVPKSSFVRLTVYDVLGRNINTLVNEQVLAGSYEVKWDASGVPTGIYFYKLVSDNYVETKKMILVK